MDTNKYILPDQVNGNGTKVQLEMRQKHLERGSVLTTTFAAETIEIPPPPLPKDSPPQTPPSSNNNNNNNMTQQGEYTPGAVSYFNPLGLQRPGSIYTLSRVSFTNQLAQLTSLQLPDAESLSSKVTNIPTAQAASRALIGAADQIRKWISKASEVIDGLDSDDDVEWAAAGGREGLEEVENAILRFEELINVYVGAIEELQGRSDIADVAPEDLQCAVVQMESILDEWRKMRTALQNVKAQVEIAMEWEELWSMVLGDIQNEMDELARLVFEMEERRHKSIMAGSVGDGSGVDIGDLETIVEETQNQQNQQPQSVPTRLHAASGNNRYSIPVFPASPTSPDLGGSGSNSTSTTATTTGTATTATTGTTGTTTTATTNTSEDDSSLLALFARMQPLRASLDFLPMRLSVFETRASSCFPTACDELEMHRENLDASYKKLEKDAESLRKELGEDRWVTVFRGAARQAQKMYESVERSVAKLKEAIDAGLHLTNPALMGKKMENYESKKTHYGPAIERVLAIIDRGVQDRLTLNGEILRLHAELQAEWSQLKEAMHEVDVAVEELHADESRNQQLRDSISSMLSNDRSTIGSGHDTPQSSPPSSVILSTLGLDNNDRSNSRNAKHGNKNNANNNAQKRPGADKPPFRPPGYTNSTYTPTSIKRRPGASSHLPQPTKTTTTTTPSRKPMPRFSTSVSAGVGSMGSGAAAAKSSPIRDGSVTPMGRRSSMLPSRPSSSLDKRPRWNSSTNGVDTGHNFKPLTLTTPSPYAKTKTPVTRRTAATTPGSGPGSGPGSSGSGLSTRLPMRSPLSRATSMSPGPDGPSQGGTDGPDGTPTRGRPLAVRDMPLRPRLASQASMAALDNRRASMQQPPRMANQDGLGLGMAPRPASSMAMSRRASMLPTTTTMHGRKDSSVSGRESPQAVAGARMAMRKKAAEQALKERPRWRV